MPSIRPTATRDASAQAAHIASLCAKAAPTPEGWIACCPAHEDTSPSLSISVGDQKVLLHCFAGCTLEAICSALMLHVADLFCGEKKGKVPIVATYDYTDEAGTLLFQACRLQTKKFFQRQPDPTRPDAWVDHIKSVRRVLYHLPEVRAAIARGDPIYITEGEKDADNLRALGLTATCNPMGAGKWTDHGYTASLAGAHCLLLPDHDTPGADHMAHVARQLTSVAASVRIVPGIHTPAAKSDVSDWLAAGGTRERLEAAAASALPWQPTPIVFHAAVSGATNGTNTPLPPGQTSGFDPERLYTDSYNARALVQAHGADLRYCYPWKSWLVWTGTHWERDTSGVVMRLAKQTIKDLARLLPALDDKQAFALLAHIKSSLSTAKLKAMLENAQSEDGIAIQPADLDCHPFLLNCANGTIDLRTGTLRAALRTEYLTRCLSVPYDPMAVCPRWEAFLTRAMDHKQGLVAFLHRAIGYSLTGTTREQCLFILHGPTKTGKSTFLTRLHALLGPYSAAADMESFMHKDRAEIRNDLADLAGARVVCAVEAQEGRRLNENLIKQLTGGVDQVKARFLFEEFFTYTPQYKVWLGTNHKPVIRDADQAIWERIRLVPFIVQIPLPERDKNLDETLQQELPGILTWAVRGCLDWQRLNDLAPPPEVLQATASYQKEMDVIGRFLDECCVIQRQARVKMGALYAAFKQWREEAGEPDISLKAIGTRLEEMGFQQHISAGKWRLGIGLASPPEK